MFVFVLSAVAAGGSWNQLHAPDAEASSFLKSNWNKFTENYHPAYVLDGDPKTAWVEGVEGTGTNQWISWRVSPVSAVHRVKLRIRNGYQKSPGLLTANAAPRSLTVELLSHGRVVHTAPWSVERKMDWQTLELDPTADLTFDAVRLTVGEVVEGRTYADLCISDVEVFVDSDTAYSAPVENAKRVTLKKWVEERKAAAAYFASRPKEYPFVSTHFVREEAQPMVDVAAFESSVIPAWKAAYAARAKSGALYRTTTKGAGLHLPDGLDFPWELVPFLSEVTYFEATDAMRPAVKQMDGDYELGSKQLSNVRRTVEDGTSTVTFKSLETWNERSTTTTTREWRLQFRGDTLVKAFMTGATPDDIECDDWRSAAEWTPVWEGSKLQRVEVKDYVACKEDGEMGYTRAQTYRLMPRS